MADEARVAIVVVCEAQADQHTAATLADRVLCGAFEWIDATTIEHVRCYRGVDDRDCFLEWTTMVKIANKHHIFAHGFVRGEKREPEAAMAERALLLVKKVLPSHGGAVMLLRDADKEGRRKSGFKQAREASPWPFQVIIGIANTKRECWVLAGYEPRDDAERLLLEAERKELGFDPRQHAEELTASTGGAKRDAKRVLKALTGGNRDRESACLEEASLDLLKQRGGSTGLADYLLEVEERLVPLFDR
jgi:hypothetical protein